MMRALFSGVSGLKSHQTRMDVIGNNIANVNTTGFKAKRLNFADMLYQTTQAGTAANTETQRGGINPRQIGLGVKTGAINTSITTEGASQSTGNPFDLKLTGEAFFIVSDGTNTYYTRDGSFDVDDAGNLVMANTGYTVMGWTQMEGDTLIQSGSVSPINVYKYQSYEAGSTKDAYISGILDRNDDNLLTDNGRQVNMQIYDNRGYEYNLKFGIKPQMQSAEEEKSIANTERVYDLPKYIVPDDASGVTFMVNFGDGKQVEVSSADMPDGLYDALVKKAMEKKGADNPSFSITEITDVEISAADIWSKATITPVFSEDIVYVAYRNYSATDSTQNDKIGEVSIDKELLDKLVKLGWYTLDDATGVYKVADKAEGGLVVTQQKYSDETPTDYNYVPITTYSVRDSAVITTGTVPYADIAGLLSLDRDPEVLSQYTTVENVVTTKAQDGYFTLNVLGMTDSEGNEVNINSLNRREFPLVYNTDDGSFSYVGASGEDSFDLNLSAIADYFDDLTVNMSDTSNVDNEGKSSLEGLRSDGRKYGEMTGVSVGTNGIVTVQYSNGMTRDIAQIAVATFANAMGLENAGDNLYKQTQSSGDVSIVDIAASGTGYMTSGVLEMSNVDLSQEFTEMITTQRGFQANSRIITTSDSILEELVNLKR